MRTLLEKEIRLLLPAFVGAIILAILPVRLMPYDPYNGSPLPGWLLFFGALILVVSSFGREINCKTLSFMLVQPLERTVIWWTKIAVLAVFLTLVFGAWWLSTDLRDVPWGQNIMALGGAAMLAGGMWLTLMLRQTVAAFWLAILMPALVALPVVALGGAEWMAFTTLGLYTVTAFFLAMWQFFHLQDTVWTGGVISFASARATSERTALREYRPWAALIGKELQLHQFTLLAIAGLLLLHVGAVVLRNAGAPVLGKSMLLVLEGFGFLWVIVPMVAGSQIVSDERQLGTMDGLLCLPITRRLQFAIKLIFVLVLGGLLSASLLCGVEWIGNAWAGGARLRLKDYEMISYAFLALSLCSFYASTLTRGVPSALAALVAVAVVLWSLGAISLFVCPWPLWPTMAIPALTVALIWLAYGNFRFLLESGRQWRRNIFVLTTVFVLSGASATATYHRFWEWVMPLDTAHGPARLPIGKPILLSFGMNRELAFVLPDGRLWEGSFTPQTVRFRADGYHFVTGSNWIAAFANWRETTGIRSDGTLWVSQKPAPYMDTGGPSPLVQFGVQTDWQSLACNSYSSVILLKRDGTLWRWGTNNISSKLYPGLRAFQPDRLGTGSDWARILGGERFVYAWKRDGSAWMLSEDYLNKMPLERLAPGIVGERAPGLDHLEFRSLSLSPNFAGIQVAIREDGTLWYWDWVKHWVELRRGGSHPASQATWPVLTQLGKDSDWGAVTEGVDHVLLLTTWSGATVCHLVALKTDGSLWKWKSKPIRDSQDSYSIAFSAAPARLGTLKDWVGLGAWWGGTVTLSADGSLWAWQTTGEDRPWGHSGLWLAPSRRPAKIENIFGARE